MDENGFYRLDYDAIRGYHMKTSIETLQKVLQLESVVQSNYDMLAVMQGQGQENARKISSLEEELDVLRGKTKI